MGKEGDRLKNDEKREEGRRKMGSKATLLFWGGLFFNFFHQLLACSWLIKRNVAV